ncbi:MAG: DUF2911 domain-containing protein [Ferruginibacter sp.]|nr:DUF2911 domain-containing protein [Ferruginibacter sp.]
MKKKFLLPILFLFSLPTSFAQGLTTIADGGNKKASVTETIGITEVSIQYNRPAVKGREGQIWGKLVPYGFNDLGFGTSKQAPWRSGANENTTISFSTDVTVEGKNLAAGIYGFFLAMTENEATIIFSRNASSWGSYFYDPKEDALRVTVKTIRSSEKVERLKFEFSDEKENSAVITMAWESLKIPFAVSVDYVKTQLESFRKELRSNKGFDKDAWVQAAAFCVSNNTNLDEALLWSEYAINGVFVGQKTFNTLNGKAAVLAKLGRSAAADSLRIEAMPLANMNELHEYGRQLVAAKKPAEALTAFKLNAQKNPNVYTTNMGLARGYAANNDFKNALRYIKLAQQQSADKAGKDAIDGYIKLLQEGRDIN